MANLTAKSGPGFCPYVGLRPYTEHDRAYFFGRERDTRVIAASLRAAPLTVFYGASGVGKSSVLMAGVLPQLLCSKRTAVVLWREWQARQFAEDLRARCLTAVVSAAQEQFQIAFEQPLDAFLKALGKALGGPILLVFDQFEEYLLYHANDKEGDAFDAELAQTINREDVDANVLISLREDSLAALDKFNARIPNLLSNILRLDHMALVSADAAVRKPIEVYNGTESGDAVPVTIEDALVDAVIADVRIGQVRLAERGGTGRLDSKADTERVETSFLQLVLEKLWQADVEAGPRRMRLETYKRLGGAQEIVSSHFGQAMQKLDDSEQAVCARFFDRLVTPSGTKIAYSVSDLVQFAGGNEDEVARVLKKLTDARILRTIEARGGGENHGVEIFHDVMALPVLQWVAQFTQKKQKAAARRQVVKRIVQGAAILLFVTGFAAFRYYDLWLLARPWAYVEDLATGKASLMQGETFSIGRNNPVFKHAVLLKLQTISRLHLLVDSSGMAFDMRSLNGTTVNAQFLPYADGQQLEDGDLVTLAGVVPFRYHTINYVPLQFWVPSIPESKPPAGAWALVLDGSTREVTFLSSDVYYLSLNAAGQIILADREPATPLMIIRHKEGGVTIEDLKDNIELIAQVKEGDYDYPEYVIPSGIVLDHIGTKVEDHDLFEVAYRYRDTPFQLIPILRDLQ